MVLQQQIILPKNQLNEKPSQITTMDQMLKQDIKTFKILIIDIMSFFFF